MSNCEVAEDEFAFTLLVYSSKHEQSKSERSSLVEIKMSISDLVVSLNFSHLHQKYNMFLLYLQPGPVMAVGDIL